MTMKIALLIPVCIIMLLAACHQQEPISQLKEINEALEMANLILEDKSHLAYEEMSGKAYDPRTTDQAKIWEPRALVIRRCAAEVKMLIDSLKSVLIKQSDSLKDQDRTIVKQILNTEGIGDKLFEKLVLFKDSAAGVFAKKEFINNSLMVESLNKDSISFCKSLLQTDVAQYSKEDWLNKNFDNCSPLLAVMALNKIEAYVIRTENDLANYCNMRVVFNFCGYYKPSAIASLNNSVIKSGDTVMVTAGVGVFGSEMSPRITINGIRIKLYETPVAQHEFIATGKPGTYEVPVKIEYTESDGSRKTADRNLRYIITDK